MAEVSGAEKNHFQCMTGRGLQYGVVVAILLVVIALSILVFTMLWKNERDRIDRDFSRASQDRVAAIENALDFDILVLNMIQSFYDGSVEVDRGEFHVFVSPLLKEHLSLHAVEWVPRVRQSDLTQFLHTTERYGYRDFTISEHDAKGAWHQASGSGDFFPIFFVEPATNNKASLGCNLASIPACLKAMNAACETGQCVMTSMVSLSCKGGKERGVRAFLPVFRKNASLNTPEERRTNLEGYIVGVLNPRGIVEEGVSNLLKNGINIQLLDSSNPEQQQTLYTHWTRLQEQQPLENLETALPDSRFRFTEEFKKAGRHWTVVCTASPRFITLHATWYPWVIAFGVLLLIGLLGVHLFTVANRNVKTSRLTDQVMKANRYLEKEIEERKQAEAVSWSNEIKYKTLYDASTNAFLLMTPDGEYLDANPAATAIFGCQKENNLFLLTPSDLSPEYQPDGIRSAEKMRQIIDVALHEESHHFEWVHKRVDGTEFLASITLTRMEVGGDTLFLVMLHDITEQRRKENALRESENRYRQLFDHNIDAIFVAESDSKKLVDCNIKAEFLTGYSREEILSMHADQLHPDSSRQVAMEGFEMQMAGAMYQPLESTVITKSGTIVPVTISAGPVEIGGKTYNIGVFKDISEQKRAAAALEASERRFLDVLHTSKDAMLLLDGERYVDGNEAAAKMLGYSAVEECILSHPDWLSPPTQPDGRPSYEKAIEMIEIARREGFHRFEWVHRKANGEDLPVEVSLTAVVVQGKNMFLSLWRDISEQKRAEATLAASERRLRMFAENASDVIWTMDLSGRFTFISPSAQRQFGFPAEEYVAFTLADIMTPESFAVANARFTEVISAAARGERIQPGNVELEMLRKDGSTVWCDISYSGMYDESGIMVAIQGVTRNISERRRMEEELRQAKEAAEAATKAKSQFLATMSHEIRTPMTAILGYADMLLDPTLSASTRNNYSATIRRSGEHLLALINDILDLSKIEAGRMTLDIGPCNIVSLLGDVASVVRPRASAHGVSFCIEYVGEIPETILTDGARLRQAIINLTGNAVKFTEKGSVRVVVSRCELYANRSALKFEVIDTGIGIRKDVLPHLFQPFSQGDSSVTRKYGGTGLGLVISHHLAHMLNGELTVESVWEQGSTFTLTVPTGSLEGVRLLQSPVEAEQEASGHEWHTTMQELQGLRILLAEDGYDNRELIRAILCRCGAEVATAENGRLAVEQASGDCFDVILMDMNMPEMDGYEATSILRDRGYAGPILALTANAMAEDRQRCRLAGCDEYLTKPIDRRILIQAIAKFAGKKTFLEEMMPSSNTTAPALENEAIISEFIDDPEMKKIILGFTGRLGGHRDAMRQAYDAKDFEELRRSAHKLKGAGGSYGYPSLTEACKTLENAASMQDDAAAGAALNTVVALIRAIENGCRESASAGTPS